MPTYLNVSCLQLKQHLMHYLSYTKSRCLTNTPMCFGACYHQMQGVTS